VKRLRFLLEAALLWAMLGLFRLVGIDAASAIGGAIGRTVGPLLSKDRLARANLKACFPAMTEAEMKAVTRAMWDNLGRFMGEMPHLHEVDVYGGDRVSVALAPEAEAAVTSGRPLIFFTAHFGNWEVSPLLATQRGIDTTLVYRQASNPWSEKMIQHWRKKRGGDWVPKGREGARAIVATLSKGGALAILADQKFNEGLPVPFFGREAMTAPAIAELALKFKAPLVPVRVERLEGARFRVVVLPPMALPETGERKSDVMAILTAINSQFEAWIRERPGHWLWIHRRWPR
jgi:Kdo2-lipid IVA lauroyltransferase/acyltransferase